MWSRELVIWVGLTSACNVPIEHYHHADAPFMPGQEDYLKASNTDAEDNFGSSVALSEDGSTLAVGAPGEGSSSTTIGVGESNNSTSQAGAVYVFTRDGATWRQKAYIKASNTDEGDAFGFSVALSRDGSILAVGARGEDSGNGNQTDYSASDAGAVYVFARNGTVWGQQAYIKASNPAASDYFGSAIALSADGSTLAVGAFKQDGPPNDHADDGGAVYVFARDGTTWLQQAYIRASDTLGYDLFGASVSLSEDGSTLAVGASEKNSHVTDTSGALITVDNAGAAYVFVRSGTSWSQQVHLQAPKPKKNGRFGSRVALAGDGATLAVGSGEAASSTEEASAVHVFTRTDATWSRQADVLASPTETLDAFGHALALSSDGSLLAVSAYHEGSSAIGIGGDQTNNAAPNSGAVYMFLRGDTSWHQQAYVKASNTGAMDEFGFDVALSADGVTLAVGADREASDAKGTGGPQADDSESNAGAVYVFALGREP